MVCTFKYDLMGQSYKQVDINLDGTLLDLISLESDHIHLVTSKGIYDFNDLNPSPMALVKDKSILKPSQNFSRDDKISFYPLSRKDYICYDRHNSILRLGSGDLEGGMLFESRNGTKWMVNNSLYKYSLCLLYTSPSPRDATLSRMPSSA